jgi:hypothetical protein
MTSQVVLANSSGVAIASDTAVTSGNRVQNGVEKIFPLSAPHKIAIVITNCASFMSVPWESILTRWSEGLTEPLDTVPAYWFNLSSWLERNFGSTNAPTKTEDYLILKAIRQAEAYIFQNHVVPFLKQQLNEQLTAMEWQSIEQGNPHPDLVESIGPLINDESWQQMIDNIESEYIEVWAGYNVDADDLHLHLTNVLDSYLNRTFDNSDSNFESLFLSRLPNSSNLANCVYQSALTWLSVNDQDLQSELCFAGYGKEELLPTLYRSSTFAIYGGKLQQSNFSLIPKIHGAEYLFLGQNDALENLMRGYDKTLIEVVIEQDRKFKEIKEMVALNPNSTKLSRQVEVAADNSELFDKIEGRDLDGPLFRLIESSPLTNLANFAGSLVSIQAAFASITQNPPTVGGSIDIATVNLRSGFTWIRRDRQ